MMEMYSKAKDCYMLADSLDEKLKGKIRFYGTTYIEYLSGKYLSSYRKNHGENISSKNSLAFYIKFSRNEFLRISVGSYNQSVSLGEKIAALSNFCDVLKDEYGKPTIFYTTKDDEENKLSLQWSFINKEEEIAKFRSGKYFDDAQMDKLIIIGENNLENKYEITERKIGLPFELIDLVDEDLDNFIKHKFGKKLGIKEGARVDGYPVKSFEKKFERKFKRL